MARFWLPRRFVIGRHPGRTAVRIVALILGTTVVFGWMLKPTRLTGMSMEPTISSGHLSLINACAYTFGRPSRGDIVAIRMAGPSVVYVKRIVGLPGERLSIDRGRVLINDSPLDEPSVISPAPWELTPIVLGADEYFVVGDNRRMPMRDHVFGRVNSERILGKVVW
jgi:signal peptidase I